LGKEGYMTYEHTFINKGGQMKTKVLTGMPAMAVE
jgi:hypothetical protein